MNQLSDEILEKIFQYLSCKDLVENLYFVCRKWRRIIRKMDKTLNFDGMSDASIQESIYKFPNTISNINLDGLHKDVGVLFTHLRRKQKNLKHVSMNNCKLAENSASSALRLRNFLEFHTGLESLTLKNCEFIPEGITDVFPKLINLRSLTIGNIPNLTSPSLMTLLLNGKNLTCINLYQIKWFTDQDMKFLLSNERLNNQLKEFCLDQVAVLKSPSYDYILKCPNLEKFRINYSTEFSPETLMKIRIELPRLKSLVIERVCRIKCKNLRLFFQNNPLNLNEFGLADCCMNFDDEAAMDLILNQCKNLLHLKLSNCCKLTKIDNILEKCKFLKTLDLEGCEQLCQDISIVPSCLSKIILPFHMKEKVSMNFNCDTVDVQFKKNYDNFIEINA